MAQSKRGAVQHSGLNEAMRTKKLRKRVHIFGISGSLQRIFLRNNKTKAWSIVLITLTSLQLSPHAYDMATRLDTLYHTLLYRNKQGNILEINYSDKIKLWNRLHITRKLNIQESETKPSGSAWQKQILWRNLHYIYKTTAPAASIPTATSHPVDRNTNRNKGECSTLSSVVTELKWQGAHNTAPKKHCAISSAVWQQFRFVL